ncbi:uncharacterized protein LOC111883918 [Lactuca sativa]|uniref:F-box domain-containing protein n=1 Tax=Lactuca sativa TaxID=4236 RepID=A0A9R1V575_LACSA|nr:uncharacterized protein LOC111883918 [Lactuca sativa]XP_042752510.1 uncharacterized protein LOC111883918 [Lactuca sativa]KAJ0198488.1 hypothetical protein LSAT_V11C700358940 [Lactuca sativa]
MAKTMSVTRNDDDASSSSSRKRFKTFDNGGVASWSDVNHDVLFIVMMKLGVVDFVAFSGVCKSWRSLAVSNRNTFMASKPPMQISIGPHVNKEDSYYFLEDLIEGRFKTIIPHSSCRAYFGLTCGYLILFGRETRDFWLVNPITRDELHFPNYPLIVTSHEVQMRAIKGILVFSPSISGCVFVVLHRKNISFSIVGKQGWNHISSPIPTPEILDLHVLKGKIYSIHTDSSICELRLDQNQNLKWTSFETKNYPKKDWFPPEFVSSGEKLYMIYRSSSSRRKVMELDFGEMKWVPPKKTTGECVFFLSRFTSCVAIKPESWPELQTLYRSCGYFLDDDKSRQCMFCYEWMWYFPHDCLNVTVLDE